MKRSSFVYFVTRGIARWVFSLFYRLEIKGERSFFDEGPKVILPKHQYWTDIPIVSMAFKPMLHFVAKIELFRFPGAGAFLSLAGGIPVNRDKSIRTFESFKYLFSLLKAGEKIVIFPEGTYVRKTVGRGKSRLLQMILKSQSDLKSPIPFIPVGIRYGERAGWRRRVEVRIGSPLFAEKESDAAALTQRVMEEIGLLCRFTDADRKQ
jgi:1-acyl-sn-glycerol-3-phosphate acyltransferase